MNTWRTLLLLALALLVAFVLYPHVSTRTSAGDKRQEITLWMPVTATESLQTAVEEFERTHPQYRVVLGAATVRDTATDQTRFLLGVAGGAPPDVIFFDRYAVVEWASRGAFYDLNAFVAADQSRPDGIHADNYYPPMWEEPRYQGHQYAIPIGVDIRALYINDDLLIRAGFVNPDGSIRPPKTWEDICRKKFHGTGTITATTIHLGKPGSLAGVGEFPVATDPPQAGDVVALCSGQEVFRARIKEVTAANTLILDFQQEQPPGVDRIPAHFAADPNTQVKVFDGNSYALRMTRFDQRGDLDVVGFTPLAGNAWLYIYGWQNGATFMSPDGTQCQLDQPEVKGALQFMVDCYDALGGYAKVADYEAAQRGSPLHPFLTGKIAMRIDGDWFLSTIATLKPDLRFSLVAGPIPAARLAAGYKPITWAGGRCYAISATAKNPAGGWELIRFLMSEKAIHIQTEVTAAQARGQGQVYNPGLHADRRILPWYRQTYLAHNPAVSARLLQAYDQFIDLLPESKYRPITPVGQKLFQAQGDAQDAAISHLEGVHEALTLRTRQVQEDLERRFHPPTGPRINWNYLILAYLGLLLIGAGVLVGAEIRHRRAHLGRRDWLAGFTCVSPWLLGFIIVGGGPILFSLLISFCRYDVLNPAQFTGFDNYTHLLGFHRDPFTSQLVANDPTLWLSLANTAFMVIGIPLGIIAGMFLAMLLGQSVRGIAFFRTLYYLPSIVPSIASFLLWMWIFDSKRGLFNSTLITLGITHPPSWLSDAAWSKPALIIMGLWGVGGGMLIWLAGLKNIPLQLYEAAEIDGAGPLRRFFHVTLPMLSPYIFFNTVMGLIGTLQVFEAAFIMTDGGPNNSTLFFAYKLFNEAFRYLDMGAASAMAWIMFALVLALTLLQLWLSKKWVHYD